MPTYSLLQVSLDQTIDLPVLEDASEVTQSITRADCGLIQRELFGILVAGLPLAEAQAFQAELKSSGFLTEVVSDDELPTLHEPFTIQRIEIGEDCLVFTDTMGREQSRPIKDLVFLAGGFLIESHVKSKLASGRGILAQDLSPAMWLSRDEREYYQEDMPTFRLDFFFWSSPSRLRASVSAESMMFFHGRPVRLRDTALLLGAMMDLRELLPQERVGKGLLRSDTKAAYPSLRSYEEEIRWHFFRLKSSS